MKKAERTMDTSQLRINGERLLADFEALCQIGATPLGGVSRPALSLEDLEARAWFADRIEEAGFFVRDDDAGNLSGVMTCNQPDAKTFVIGSHLDTVPNGGRYDGAIGVLAALEAARTVKEAGVRLPWHLEVMDFTDEEGTWFGLFGSRGLTGRLSVDHLRDIRGDDGAFRAAMARAGIDVGLIHQAKRDPATLAGYLEMHIEQGGRLDAMGVQIGVVTGIVGRSTTRMTFLGGGGHSGTADWQQRRDALQGAAAFVTQAHQLARDHFPDGVLNCGALEVMPGTFNVIPERATLMVECRHPEEAALARMETQINEMAAHCARTYGLTFELQRVIHMNAAPMNPGMITHITRTCDAMGLSRVPLVSYAGHDAQQMSWVTPTGMIFIPSLNGISHTPQEFSTWDDVMNGANVLLQSLLSVARDHT